MIPLQALDYKRWGEKIYYGLKNDGLVDGLISMIPATRWSRFRPRKTAAPILPLMESRQYIFFYPGGGKLEEFYVLCVVCVRGPS